jgi:hypothetical protein
VYLTIRVLQTETFRAHEGFTLADLTRLPAGTLSYELFQCTHVGELRRLVARDMGVEDADQLRLWIITQPWAESVAAPRELLMDKLPHGPPATLVSQLQCHSDGIQTVRLWAERSGDGGFGPAGAGRRDKQPGAVARLKRTVEGEALPEITLAPDPLDRDPEARLEGEADEAEAQQKSMIVFAKFLDPSTGRIRFLTHLVADARTPLNALFRVSGRRICSCW